MKVLVTGGTGFIGARYVEHLLRRGDVSVSYCGRSSPPPWADLKGADFLRGNLADDAFAEQITRNVDAVVHCAGLSGLWGGYERYYTANVVCTEHIIRGCQRNGVPRLVNLSSPGIYFDHRDHINVAEDFLPDRFTDNYPRTKYQAERRVVLAHSDTLRTLSLRPRLVIGRGDRAVFPRIIELARAGVLRRIGSGRNIVSVTSIDNLIQALDCTVFGPDGIYGDVYNIANPQPVRLWDVIDTVVARAGLPPVTRRIPYGAAIGLAHASEALWQLLGREDEPWLTRSKVSVLARSLTLGIEKARRKLGYRPVSSLEQAIEEYFQASPGSR